MSNEDLFNVVNIMRYKLMSAWLRKSHIHGGICVFVENHVLCKKLDLDQFCGVELTDAKKTAITVYRHCTRSVAGNFLQAYK